VQECGSSSYVRELPTLIKICMLINIPFKKGMNLLSNGCVSYAGCNWGHREQVSGESLWLSEIPWVQRLSKLFHLNSLSVPSPCLFLECLQDTRGFTLWPCFFPGLADTDFSLLSPVGHTIHASNKGKFA
jgi:hypothetical protein